MLGLFLGSKAEAVRLLKPITSVGTPKIQTIRSLPYPQAVSFLLAPDPVQTQRFSNQFSSAFARKPFPDQAFKPMREFLEKVEGKTPGSFSSTGVGL